MTGDAPELGTGGMWLTEGRPFIHFGTQPGEFEWVEAPIERWWHRFTRRGR